MKQITVKLAIGSFRSCRFALALGLLSFCPVTSTAAELVPQGPQAKYSAGAGQTTVTGGSALFYNPANMGISAGSQVDFDIGFLQYRYQYTHPDKIKYQPVTVAATAPPISLAGSYKPMERLTLGVSFVPTGVGDKQIVIDIPLYLGGDIYQLSDVELKTAGNKLAVGAAWRLTRQVLIGLSLVRMQESTDTAVFIAGDLYPFLRLESSGIFYQPALGIRTNLGLRSWSFGLSYQPMVAKKSKGRFLFDLGSEEQLKGNFNYQPLEEVAVAPTTIGVGVQWRVESWAAFAEASHEAWSQGQGQVRRGIPIASPKTALKSTLNTYTGVSYRLSGSQRIFGSYGYQPANLSDGSKREPEETMTANEQTSFLQAAASQAVEGMTFGNTSGIPRNIWALGYQRPMLPAASSEAKPAGYGSLAIYSLQGQRTVPSGFSQEGTYTLAITMVTAGGAWRF